MMLSSEAVHPLQAGDPAPDFELPAADHEGLVGLAQYRGRSPVLLSLLRGLYCPFCRRQLALLSDLATRGLKPLGVESLAVVASGADRTRLYFRYHPAAISTAADPDLATHRAYRLPNTPMTEEILGAVEQMAARFLKERGATAPPGQAMETAARLVDSFQPGPAEQAEAQRHQAQLVAQFLIDRSGVIRWSYIEGSRDGLAGVGQFPSPDEVMTAARAVA